jgi:glycosyltransferase involved in cell wall biosynthesis
MAEAMACGTPVIGFPLGSVPEVVENGVTGFVCKDVDEMVESIMHLNQINRQTVREAAEVRFGNKTIVDNYLNLYNSLIKKGIPNFLHQNR